VRVQVVANTTRLGSASATAHDAWALHGTHDGTLQPPIGEAARYTNLAAALAH
jgi:hypothetical protein